MLCIEHNHQQQTNTIIQSTTTIGELATARDGTLLLLHVAQNTLLAQDIDIQPIRAATTNGPKQLCIIIIEEFSCSVSALVCKIDMLIYCISYGQRSKTINNTLAVVACSNVNIGIGSIDVLLIIEATFLPSKE
uniref:Uncharacterized protein n=1 Tax=Glossina palpalis gambiensis TaxID=67801 RepID=A0A1B0BJU3_9MUSC